MPTEPPSRFQRHFPSLPFVIIAIVAVATLAGAIVYAGIYNIGADSPHWRMTYMGLEQVRERAIEHHSRDIVPPRDLGSALRVSQGAGLYKEMCTGCHLGPGMEKSELSQGLYPPAPEFARASPRSPQQQFWIIKHGVKFSAMPAWGVTHDDNLIWDMVSFIRALPKMTPEQYQAALASAPEDHDEMMKDMPGMVGKPHADEPASAEKAPHTHAPGHEHTH